jgi:hypothetical protein
MGAVWCSVLAVMWRWLGRVWMDLVRRGVCKALVCRCSVIQVFCRVGQGCSVRYSLSVQVKFSSVACYTVAQ